MHPLLIEGSRLLGPSLVAAARTIPASQLARFGLLRGPLVGLAPTVGSFLVGAAATALLVPSSRAWLLGHARRGMHRAKEWGAKDAAEEPAGPLPQDG